jgi:ketosteroid isomerase-like protein
MSFGPASDKHRDVLTYVRTADAFRRRDLNAIAESIHEAVTWHFPGKTWLSRELHGREALMSFLHEVVVRTASTFVLEDLHISGTDHHVIALQRFGATFDGQTEMFEAVSVMRFEEGRQIERWFHLLDPDAFDAFFSKFG